MEPRDLSMHSVYRAGRGIEEVARELGLDPDELIKLSSNENSLGPSPKAVEAIRDVAEDVHYYPKSSHTDLIAKLAEKWSLDDEQIWLANGGDGALDYLSRALLDPGQAVLVPDPDFTYHGMSAKYHHGRVETFELSKGEGFHQSPERVLDAYDGQRIVYLTSPHNPTGSEVTIDEVERIAEETDERTLVVVDEAYEPFSERASKIELVRERDDVALLRSFSKAYGLAGIRLGYAITPSEWGDAYARVNTPFAASEIACRAGLAALEDGEFLEETIETARWGRAYMRENLDAPTWESGGNFVLVEVGDAETVADACQRAGVIVRDCTSFGLPECIRVTTGTRSETRQAVETINGVLADVRE
ncbi:MAG: histidinol-phosphate transaminase [Halapricum sp.]